MGKIERFEQLVAWQKAHALVLEVYRISKQFPDDERFGIISQLRRAAVSVPANIAEGFKRRSKPEKCRFYNIAEGSLEETRCYLDSAIVRAPRASRQVLRQGGEPISAQAYLRYGEHEIGDANAA